MDTLYKYEDQLQTGRLLTRFLTQEDNLIWSDFFRDKEAIAFFPVIPFSSNEEKATWWIEKQLIRYKEGRFGLQALINRQTGEFIGQCGLLTQEVDGIMEIEISYDIFKRYWGQGYATEASKRFIDYAFENNLAASVIAIIAKDNVKAQRVAEKNGLVREKQAKWSDIDVYIYRITKQKRNGNCA